MIPKDYITAWRTHAPWRQDAQVEQDLVISRAIVEMFRVEDIADRLAFCGGTADSRTVYGHGEPAPLALPGLTALNKTMRRINTMKDQLARDIRGWDAIEDHRTGTEGDGQTTAWLADCIAAAGAEPYVDTFDFVRPVLHECAVSVDGRRADGVPLFDGGTTDADGIMAPLAPLAAAETGIGFASSGPWATAEIEAAREAATLDALVRISSSDRIVPGLALVNADRFGHSYGPPVLQVASEHGDWLQAAAGARADAHLVAHVTDQNTTASNVQTRITGSRPGAAPLVIMTPRSAWWTCTAERGGGISIWLQCIRHFAQARPERDVIFTANTGHELGHVGLDRYLQRNAALIKDAHAWIHLGANFATVDSNIRFQASDQTLMNLGIETLERHGAPPQATTPVGQRPGGEARNIHDGGGCYVSLVGDNRWFHHPDDRWPTTIDLERTEKIARATLAIAAALARA